MHFCLGVSETCFFLFPSEFRVRACLVMLLGGFLRVLPIKTYFLLRICTAIFPSLLPFTCPHKSNKTLFDLFKPYNTSRLVKEDLGTHCHKRQEAAKIYSEIQSCIEAFRKPHCIIICTYGLFTRGRSGQRFSDGS